MHSFEQISHEAAFVASLGKTEDFFFKLQTFMITVIPQREKLVYPTPQNIIPYCLLWEQN